MKKFYLAARWGRKEEMRAVRDDLVALGFEVTSGWIDSLDNSDDETGNARPLELCRQDAERDLVDLMRADVVVSFTEPPGIGPMRGGRHVEFGVALGAGKELWVVGFHENIFHALATVRFFESWARARRHVLHTLLRG